MNTWINWFKQHPVLILGLIFLFCSTLIFSHLYYLNTSLIKTSTIQSARQYAEVLTKFRSLYTSEVIEKIHLNGLIASHDYKNIANAVPLPATLSMLLGEQMGLEGMDVKTRLYSAYPFPWREKTGGLSDQFAQDAWTFLLQNKDQAFIRIEQVHGVASVRYAVADTMRDSCVSCHNTDPNSPKTGWQSGDVRGVLEVIQPLNQGLSNVKQIFVKIVSLVALMLIITLFILYWFLRRLKQENLHSLQLNQQLAVEVKERRQAEDEAVLANKTKSLFLANISHEIRTPMNAILGYAQILQRDKSLRSNQRHSLSIIENSGSHLLGLINDLLDIAKIESGVLELHQNPFDIAALMHSLSDMFQLKASQKKLHWKLYLDFPSDPLIVLGDESKLRQILINLIGNSVKFTDQGFVQLKASICGESTFIFCITDSGLGLNSEEIARIGTPFSQGNAGMTKGGTGLGLSISQRYLKLMNSELKVESVPQQGTSVSFELKLPIDKKRLFARQQQKNIKSLAQGHSLHILVIDDNVLNRQVLEQLLTSIGAGVIQVENGNKALQLLAEHSFDIIFTDIDMPGIDGYQFLQQARQIKPNQETPIVAISASTLEQHQSFFTDQGFAGYLGKPFLVNELYQCLQNVTHAEFEYETAVLTNVSDISTEIHWPEPETLHQIQKAAELCLVSDIEAQLEKLGQENQSYQAFILRVKHYLSQYDMDGLQEFLGQAYE